MCIFLRCEVLCGVGGACWESVFVDQKIWTGALVASAARALRSGQGLVVGLDLTHSLHKIYTLRQQICLLASFRDIRKVLIQFFKMCCQIHVFGFFW